MHVLLCTSYPHLPQTRGGLQTSTDELSCLLLQKGVRVTVLCGGGHDVPAASDSALAYPVVRAADPRAALPLVAAAIRPEIILVQSGLELAAMLEAALSTGFATAVYLHNVEMHRIGGVLPPDPRLLYFSNSAFTAGRWRALFGIDSHLLPPAIIPSRYQADQTGDRVLFINPVPEKGIERVAGLAAANPDIPFLVAESWAVGDDWRDWLRQRFGALRNVEWCPATDDVRDLYRQARILLMPSVWEEAYGRTVVEAQLNGLPVLASRRGALPQTVGEGGDILDLHASDADWSRTLRSLYFDVIRWQHLSDAARVHADREVLAAAVALDDALARLAVHALSPRQSPGQP